MAFRILGSHLVDACGRISFDIQRTIHKEFCRSGRPCVYSGCTFLFARLLTWAINSAGVTRFVRILRKGFDNCADSLERSIPLYVVLLDFEGSAEKFLEAAFSRTRMIISITVVPFPLPLATVYFRELWCVATIYRCHIISESVFRRSL
jgi:hypothetical protein